MDNLKGDELIVGGRTAGYEKEGSVSSVDNFSVWQKVSMLDVPLRKIDYTFVFEEVAHASPSGQHEL